MLDQIIQKDRTDKEMLQKRLKKSLKAVIKIPATRPKKFLFFKVHSPIYKDKI